MIPPLRLSPVALLVVVGTVFLVTVPFAGVGFPAALLIVLVSLVQTWGSSDSTERSSRLAVLIVAATGMAIDILFYLGLSACCAGDPTEPLWPPYLRAQLIGTAVVLLLFYAGWLAYRRVAAK